MDDDDPIVSVIPIQLSTTFDPRLQLHQYPLSSRPLAPPPSAKRAGKAITARIKPLSDRLEVHVPFDTREEVWNQRRGLEYGDARYEEDGRKPHAGREEHRLDELRLRSEQVPHRGTYMVGLLRGNRLYLHPVAATHKLRPHLGYIDVLSQKARRRPAGEEDDDENDAEHEGEEREEKKSKKEAREVHLIARKTDGTLSASGISDMRREMLRTLAAEEAEAWVPIRYSDEVL
ncbi:SubName: Full=Uncharacterized protein {ECO:0000313/EMBL:CCA72043.1} [Serendipita indica DSM 11827]|nr:SubName: Full=Uncharacterized protein {ECO:0000313/EMBL:CCA72043.1} [Serendipita indica DSM 11827]